MKNQRAMHFKFKYIGNSARARADQTLSWFSTFNFFERIDYKIQIKKQKLCWKLKQVIDFQKPWLCGVRLCDRSTWAQAVCSVWMLNSRYKNIFYSIWILILSVKHTCGRTALELDSQVLVSIALRQPLWVCYRHRYCQMHVNLYIPRFQFLHFRYSNRPISDRIYCNDG